MLKTHGCPSCTKFFLTTANMRQHHQDAHKAPAPATAPATVAKLPATCVVEPALAPVPAQPPANKAKAPTPAPKPTACQHCKLLLPSKAECKRHKREAHPATMLKTHGCTKFFLTTANMRQQHQDAHKAPAPATAPATAAKLLQEPCVVVSHHTPAPAPGPAQPTNKVKAPTPAPKPTACQHCRQMLPSKAECKRHKREAHSAPATPAPPPPSDLPLCRNQCPDCRKQFATAEALESHQLAKHKYLVVGTVNPPQPPRIPETFSFAELHHSKWRALLHDTQPNADRLALLRKRHFRLEQAVGQQLYVYGSLAQNLASITSDIDTCVLDVPVFARLKTLMRCARRLRENGILPFECVFGARVPVICSESGSPIKFDLSAAQDGVRTSLHVRRYVTGNPLVVYPMVRLLSEALKRKGLHGASDGYLSSFALVLLVLHFLLWRKAIAYVELPPQTDAPIDKGCVARFPDYQRISPPATEQGIAELRDRLCDFLRFYGKAAPATPGEGFDSDRETFPEDRAVVLSPAPWRDPPRGQPGAALTIADPFHKGERSVCSGLKRANWAETKAFFCELLAQI